MHCIDCPTYKSLKYYVFPSFLPLVTFSDNQLECAALSWSEAGPSCCCCRSTLQGAILPGPGLPATQRWRRAAACGEGAIRGDTSIRTLMHRIVLEEGKKNSGFLTAIVAAGSYCAGLHPWAQVAEVTVRCCATLEPAALRPDTALGWL